MFDEDFQTHTRRIEQMLIICREYGITLNRDKLTVAAPSVNFSGYTIRTDEISMDPKIWLALSLSSQSQRM